MNISKKPHTTKTKTHHLRPVLIIIFILALIAGGLIIWRPWHNPAPETDQDYPTPEPTEGTITTPTDSSPTESDETSDATDEPDQKVPQYEADNPNTLPDLTGSIARKTIQGQTLTLVAMIDQYLHSTGLCTLRLTSQATGATVYTASEDATADVSTSICGTFVISLQDIPAGTYQITVELSGDGKNGAIVDEVEVQ